MGAFANVKGLSYYRDNNDDPYITLKEDDDELEREELALLATDSLVVTARTTADLSGLDFHVYDETNESLYTHHDLMLPSFPLCVEWLDFSPGPSSSDEPARAPGNFIAVGSFDPSIEIWDADVLDGMYPTAVLGLATGLEKPEAKPKGTGKKKRKQMVQPTANPDHHVQPVLSLSWTPKFRNLLLSGSADATVKLWDLTRESPMGARSSWDKIHKGEKVQAVEWNRAAAGSGTDTAVLSGGWDRAVRVWDAMTKEGEGFGVSVGADVECVRWDPWSPTSFYVSSPLYASFQLTFPGLARERPHPFLRRAYPLFLEEQRRPLLGSAQVHAFGARRRRDRTRHQPSHPRLHRHGWHG
jgi:periodic tryptophan protein 1